MSGVVGKKVREELKSGLLIGVQDFGKGQVVYMANDPAVQELLGRRKDFIWKCCFLRILGTRIGRKSHPIFGIIFYGKPFQSLNFNILSN